MSDTEQNPWGPGLTVLLKSAEHEGRCKVNDLAYAGFGGHGNMDLMERKLKDERTAKI